MEANRAVNRGGGWPSSARAGPVTRGVRACAGAIRARASRRSSPSGARIEKMVLAVRLPRRAHARPVSRHAR